MTAVYLQWNDAR